MAYQGLLAPKPPGLGDRFGKALTTSVASIMGQQGQFHQQMALQKQRSHSLAQETKQLEKVKIMENGLGTIQQMRGLLEFAGGWTSDPIRKLQSLVPGETQKARAELQKLGQSLIPLVAAGVPIRNQREFDEYRKVITDPSASPSELEGALNGIESLLTRGLESSFQESEEPSKQKKVKFSSSNIEHKKKAQQLYKTHKDKEKVREILSREFEF